MTVEQEETMVEVKEKLKLIDICYKNNLIRSSDIREFICNNKTLNEITYSDQICIGCELQFIYDFNLTSKTLFPVLQWIFLTTILPRSSSSSRMSTSLSSVFWSFCLMTDLMSPRHQPRLTWKDGG